MDLEHVSARQVAVAIADRFFSPTELAALSRVSSEHLQDWCFEYWTFSKSYIKARGMGLSIALDRFSLQDPHERAVRIAIEPGFDDYAGRWSLWECRPMPEYLLAICAEHLDMVPPRLIFRELVPSITNELLKLRLLKTSEPYAW